MNESTQDPARTPAPTFSEARDQHELLSIAAGLSRQASRRAGSDPGLSAELSALATKISKLSGAQIVTAESAAEGRDDSHWRSSRARLTFVRPLWVTSNEDQTDKIGVIPNYSRAEVVLEVSSALFDLEEARMRELKQRIEQLERVSADVHEHLRPTPQAPPADARAQRRRVAQILAAPGLETDAERLAAASGDRNRARAPFCLTDGIRKKISDCHHSRFDHPQSDWISIEDLQSILVGQTIIAPGFPLSLDIERAIQNALAVRENPAWAVLKILHEEKFL